MSKDSNSEGPSAHHLQETIVEPLSHILQRNNGQISDEILQLYHNMVNTLTLKSSISAQEKQLINDYARSMALLTKNLRSNQGRQEVSPELLKIQSDPANIIKINELVLKPETFDGERPRPRRWLSDYEEAINANGWTDAIAIKYFATFLRGAAKDWYFTDVRSNRIRNWSDIRKLYVQNYLGESDYQQLSQAIDRMNQRREESVSNFIPRLRRLLLMLTPDLPESEQIRQIRLKLRTEYTPLLAFSNIRTINDLKSCCLRIEAGLIRKQDRSRTETKNNRSDKYRNPKITEKVNIVNKKEITCQRCDREGHDSKECFAKRKKNGVIIQSPPSKQPPSRAASSQKTILNVNQNDTTNTDDDSEVTITREVKACYLMVTGINDLIKIPILAGGMKVNAVIDTGAHVTVADFELCKQFNWKPVGTGPKLMGAGGENLEVMGTIKLEIQLQLGSYIKTKKHNVVVIKNLPAQFLIGLELMRSLEINIDTKNNKISFFPRSLTKGIFTLQKEQLPPRSLAQITGKVNFIGNILVQNSTEYTVANSISQSINGTVPVVVLNTSKLPIQLEEGVKIAGFETLDDDTSRINSIVPLGKTKETIQLGENLTPLEKKELETLLIHYMKAFSINGEIGDVIGHEHDIELIPGAKPVVEPLRRRAQVQIEETRKQIKELLKEGIIEDSNSPWASAYVLAQKKNGTWRLCIDFRRLNAMTKKIVYPLPNIDECLDTLAGKKYFSTIDFASGFWQISLAKEAKEKTAFRTEDGQFQFTKMPFGLTNAPASFQKMINGVLSGLKGLNLQVFIDDICIATTTWTEHLEMLAKLFQAVIRANLKIKPSKCIFGANKVIFLGHEISSDGIRQDPSKLQALLQVPPPEDSKGVKRFLGMCSYYRRFVANFAIIAEPLTKLTRKNIDFQWTDKEQSAMDQLLAELARNATLTHFNHIDPIMVKTDASQKGVAGMLLQKQGEEWKLVSCCSRRLSPAETNYGITDLEGLALVYTVNKLRPYLLGKKFQIIVDHCALCALNHKLPNSARLRRWAIILSEFNFEIIYTKGQLHKDVDCLSRAPITEKPDPYLDHCVYQIAIPDDQEEWIDDYDADEASQAFYELASTGKNQLSLKNGLIYKQDRLYVPECRRSEIIKKIHEASIHPGIAGTCSKISEQYWWPSMYEEVKSELADCISCARHKSIRQAPVGQMHSFEIYSPNERVAVDSFGPIRESANKNMHIIVAIDMFTRFVELKPVPNIRKETFATFLMEYCGRYGVPKQVLSDHSKTFINELIKEICDIFGIKQLKATPYHHEGNSVVERVIQVVQEKMRMIMDNDIERDNWDTIIPLVMLSINTNFHKSIGHTPYEMTFGYRSPLLGTELTEQTTPTDLHLKTIKLYLEDCYKKAAAVQSLNQAQAKEYYDKNRRQIEYSTNQEVMIRAPSDRRNKMAPKYKGPYKVVGRKDDIYQLEEINGGKTISRHVSDLKTFGRLMTNTLTLLLLVSLCDTTKGDIMSFDRVRPVVWGTSKYKVSLGTAFYDIQFAYQNPCKLFARAIRNHPEIATESVRASTNHIIHQLEAYQRNCDEFYRTEWVKTMDQFLMQSADHLLREPVRQLPFVRNLTRVTRNSAAPRSIIAMNPQSSDFSPIALRKKRGLMDTIGQKLMQKAGEAIGAGLSDAVGFIAGNIASNLVQTVIDWINPHSVPNRVNNLENMAISLRESYDILNHVTKDLVDNQEGIAIAVKNTAMKLKEIAEEFPRFSWIGSVIVNRIAMNAMHLQRVANEAKRNRVDVDSMAFLLGLPSLSYSDLDETKFYSISKIGDDMVHLNFSINVRSPDTKVYNVYGFPHWNNISETPEYLQYNGAKLLIYNETSNCIKAIEEPISPMVIESCEELDGEDPALSSWETIHETTDIYKYENDSFVQKFEDYNYIYCFPGKISIEKREFRCPFEVFRLPSDKAFRTARQRHIPSRIRMNVTKEHSIDNVHIGHFQDDSDIVNELKLFDKITEMRNNLTQIKESKFVIDRNYGWTYAILSPVLGALFGALVYIAVTKSVWQSITSLFFKPGDARPGRPPAYPYSAPSNPYASAPYELRPMTSSAYPMADETPGKVYVPLDRPAIT